MDNTYEHSFIDSNFLESAYTAFLPMDANEDCFMAPGASSTRFMQLHSSLVNPAAIMGNIPTITSIQMHAISPNACPTIKQEPVENVQQQIRREVQESSTPSESYESQERSETPERKKRAAPKTGANEDAVGYVQLCGNCDYCDLYSCLVVMKLKKLRNFGERKQTSMVNRFSCAMTQHVSHHGLMCES